MKGPRNRAGIRWCRFDRDETIVYPREYHVHHEGDHTWVGMPIAADPPQLCRAGGEHVDVAHMDALLVWERDQRLLEHISRSAKARDNALKSSSVRRQDREDRNRTIRDAFANSKALNPSKSDWGHAESIGARFGLKPKQILRILAQK